MINDVRKSDASQRVAARTDFFGRTNQACWEQAANDAAAHVESAQTTNVLGIGGTIIATAFDDNAAPGDAADVPGGPHTARPPTPQQPRLVSRSLQAPEQPRKLPLEDTLREIMLCDRRAGKERREVRIADSCRGRLLMQHAHTTRGVL